MKLTRKLAYSQLKINRRRTIWTLLGIAISTAMITAVYGFAMSGRAAFMELMSDDRNIDNYVNTLYGISAVLSVIIVTASVIVISNAFRVSAGEQVKQFGILKSVGATKQQITEMVLNEGLLLSIIGIPAGIILGLIVKFVALKMSNYLLMDLNAIDDIQVTLHFIFAWQAVLIAIIISLATVVLSAWLPAMKAAKIPAINAIRGVGEVKLKAKQIRTNPIIKKLFGIEGVLASTSLKRNKRNLRATVISLSISIIMFVAVNSLGTHMGRMANIVFHLTDANVISTFQGSVNVSYNEDGERIQTFLTMSYENAEAITEKLREFPDAKVFGVGSDHNSYYTHIPREVMSQKLYDYLNYDDYFEQNPELASDQIGRCVILLSVDTENYAELCKLAGVPLGSNILVNYFRVNIGGKWTDSTPYDLKGKTLFLLDMRERISEQTIDLTLHGEISWQAPKEILWFVSDAITVIVPSHDSYNYAWFTETDEPDEFVEYNLAVFDEMLSFDDESPVSTSAFNTALEENAFRSIFNLIMLFTFGFVSMLTLIGLTNVISTISTNVRSRSREFAVLKSVGMTHGGLNRMLNLESILCSAKSLVIGLPLGIGASYFVYRSIVASVEFDYIFPWLAITQCIIAVFIITWVTMRFAASRLKDGNIVGTIRDF